MLIGSVIQASGKVWGKQHRKRLLATGFSRAAFAISLLIGRTMPSFASTWTVWVSAAALYLAALKHSGTSTGLLAMSLVLGIFLGAEVLKLSFSPT